MSVSARSVDKYARNYCQLPREWVLGVMLHVEVGLYPRRTEQSVRVDALMRNCFVRSIP